MRSLFLILIFTSQIIFAQKTCESNEETFEDLNSITKCSIEPSHTTDNNDVRQIAVKISSKNRYLKKRNIQKKSIASSVNNNLDAAGIKNTEHTSKVSNSLELKNKETSANTILSLSKNLSKEEFKKSLKLNETSKIPMFSNCKSKNKNEDLNCFNKEMVNHVRKHFKYPKEAVSKRNEGKVWVRFIIDTNGNVTSIKTIGPKSAEILHDEAKRVVSKLPKFIPGEKDDKKVTVKYGFPITFTLEK